MASEALEPEKAHMVLEGRDGWLFLTNDSNRVVDQMTGDLPLPEQDIEKWRLTIEQRRFHARSIGAEYLFAVAPNKEAVFREYLPFGIPVSGNRAVRQMQDAGIDLLYRPDLLWRCKTYSKTDTHWSDYGGMIQAKQIIRMVLELGISSGSLDDLDCDFVTDTHYGDLGRKLSSPVRSEVLKKRLRTRRSKLIYNSRHQTTGTKLIFEGGNKRLPRAVVFGDSFGGIGSTFDFLAQCFSRLVVSWSPTVDFQLIEEERPDIVISQMAERFLIRVPDDIRANQYVPSKLSAMISRQRLLTAE